ncbi:glycoside hydrolase [Acephala macrosclerotiorum]|nr:glycoside hydrolase [Acephala macrosclerotiorum]
MGLVSIFALSSIIAYDIARSKERSARPFYRNSDTSSQNTTTTRSQWQSATIKLNTFVSQLNLTEKASMVTGSLGSGTCFGNIPPIPRVNFPGLRISDGLTAVNRMDLVSIFPAGITRGLTLGAEFKGKGVHVGLGPVAGPLDRHPLGGRNWEGFSPDPYLTGHAMIQTITETQRTHTILLDGTNIEAISSNIDDRTLYELYLWPFADVVKAGTTSVMCSYNRFNGTYACENDELLNGILKDELGFEGYVMSDSFAVQSGAKSANAGLDMNMPGPLTEVDITIGRSYFGSSIAEAVNNGSVSVERLDDMVRRIMTPYYLLDRDKNYPTTDLSAVFVLMAQHGYTLDYSIPARDVQANHASIIRELEAAGTVLLKNANSTLLLKYPIVIGVFGNDAADLTDGLTYLASTNFDIETIDIGGRVQCIASNVQVAAGNFISIYPIPDVCLIFLKTYASEGSDRTSWEADWNSTLVVAHSGGTTTLPFADNPNVTAILATHYPGEESGNSIVDVLWEDNEADYDIPIVNLTNITDANKWQSNFTEGLLINYRHFDAFNITPLYEFGYGLSYSTFDTESELKVENLVKTPSEYPDASLKAAPGGSPDLWTSLLSLSTTVSDTGGVDGATVVQLYVSLPQDSVPSGTPIKVLREFEKVALHAGETKVVSFEIMRDVSYWDVVAQQWRLLKGEITFSVGFSSSDLRRVAAVRLL